MSADQAAELDYVELSIHSGFELETDQDSQLSTGLATE